MANFCIIILLLLAPYRAFADLTIDNVSNALLAEFYSKNQKSKDIFNVERKNSEDFSSESMSFALGDQTYKLVFFENGKITLSMGQKGDIALQEILTSTAEKTTPRQIIQLVQNMQANSPGGAQGYQNEKDKVDSEKENIKNAKKAADALRWNNLIDKVASGTAASVSSESDQSGGLGASISAAKMMNRCGNNNRGSSAQQAAAQNIAEALVLANLSVGKLKVGNDALLDRSREFEKKGTYSFLDEMDQFDQSSPERAFQLLQKTKTNEYQLFQSSLQKSNTDSKDPYFLAANRNFMFLIRTIGKDKTLGLMDEVMKKIVLSIERFVEYRKMLPSTSVVYDRNKNKYYIDPTLNEPSQARYLLSLVCMYEWKNQSGGFKDKLSQLKKMETGDQEKYEALTEDLRVEHQEFLKTTSHPRF